MNWTVGKRIIAGFSIVLVLLGITTFMSYIKIDKLALLSQKSTDALSIDKFLVEKEIDHLNWLSSLSHSIVANKEIEVSEDPTKCSLGKWIYKELTEKRLPTPILKVLEELEPLHKKLHQTVHKIKKYFILYDTTLETAINDIWIEQLELIDNINDSFVFNKVLSAEINPKKCLFGKWYNSFKTDDFKLQQFADKWNVQHHRVYRAAKKILTLQKNGDFATAKGILRQDLLPAFDKIKGIHHNIEQYLHNLEGKVDEAKRIYQEETVPVIAQVREKIKKLRKTFDDVLLSEVGEAVKKIPEITESAKIFMLTFGIFAIIVGIFLALLITRSIIGPMSRIGDSLGSISENVGAASEELSGASQQLSSIASQQAASVEETSSSLEEIEGMVQNNVANAQEAVDLANKVKKLAEDGNEVMQKLDAAMDDILDSNNKIGELVKVIANIGEKTKVMDEIVFQTKLLSFNASVEAERAGEHGRGFAVVAQEVGNLAQMSGKSAREIAQIVNDSVKNAEVIIQENQQRVEAGGELVKKMTESLQEIVEGSTVVSQGSQGVLEASTDQGKGIKQINLAMIDIDKVTQETAATAEETASASEELSAQVDSLREIVHELTELVLGEERQQRKIVEIYKKKKTSAISEKENSAESSDGWDEL